MSKGLKAWERVELYCENNSSLEHLFIGRKHIIKVFF